MPDFFVYLYAAAAIVEDASGVALSDVFTIIIHMDMLWCKCIVMRCICLSLAFESVPQEQQYTA